MVFFGAIGLPLLAGRTFQPGDAGSKADPVVIDELFAHRFFPNTNPLGRQFGYGARPPELYRIMGIVRSALHKSLREARQPIIYIPSDTATYPGGDLHFVIRAVLDTKTVSKEIRRITRSLDPEVPLLRIETQNRLIEHSLLTDRLLSIVSVAFGSLALLLSAIGLLGLLAYSVARRKNEIGIRIALGATRTAIVGHVFSESMRLVTAGIVLGLPGIILVGQFLRHILFNARPVDPIAALLTVATLLTVAALAALLPAARAAKVDAMAAIREE